MKKVIFINQDSGYLMVDIINAFVAAGYSCVLITGRLVERNIPVHPSVRIEKIVKYNRTSTFRRLFTWMVAFLQVLFKVSLKFRRDQLFIVSNPPLTLLLPLFVKNSFHLLIFDVYPDAITELGYLSPGNYFIRWWKKVNVKIFAKAEGVFTISDSMMKLLQTYAGNKIIKVVPIWTDNTYLRPIDPYENYFIRRHGLFGKFVVLYSGNIGLSGDVDVLLDVAQKFTRDDIVFLIIGDGAKKRMLIEKAERNALKNVLILPWQPVEDLPFSLASASIAVITIGSNASKLAVPSKLYNFLSVGAPLLCISTKGSEVDNLVNKYNCGECFESYNIDGMANFINDIADNRELYELLRANTLLASNDFDKSNVKEFLPIIVN